MVIGPWFIKFRSPLSIYRRPGKDWICINDDCSLAGRLRRLSDDDGHGRCKRCHHGLRRVRNVR